MVILGMSTLKVAITNSARYTTIKERYEWIFLKQIAFL